MITYRIITEGKPEIFSITNHRPEGAPAPKTEGFVRYIPGEGIEVTMCCAEQNPTAVYTQPDDPVFKDSCMEVFLNCFPQESNSYINVEMNAAGAMRCGFGPGRQDRPKVLELGLPQPKMTATKTADGWQVQCLISESLLEALYQRPCNFTSGHKMRGNFYKCGEEVDSPHWASWSAVTKLDFHMPECFGLLKMV